MTNLRRMCNDRRLVLQGRAIFGGALQEPPGTQDSFLALPTALVMLRRDPSPIVEWLRAINQNKLQVMFRGTIELHSTLSGSFRIRRT